MQGVLPISRKSICLLQVVLSPKSICHASGSVICCKRICHARVSVMQEVLCPISCKWFCHLAQVVLWSKQGSSTVSRRGFYPSHARGSVIWCKSICHARGSGDQKVGAQRSGSCKGFCLSGARGPILCKGSCLQIIAPVMACH